MRLLIDKLFYFTDLLFFEWLMITSVIFFVDIIDVTYL
jgi:hypothetical protein